MNLYICEICGEAHIGAEKPADCPFCGAKGNFIKSGDEAEPIINIKSEISELSRKNLLETLELEKRATAVYFCMAEKTKEYKIKAMYKRLAKVESEHMNIAVKFLGGETPVIAPETCAEKDAENFEKTLELENHAVELYKKFSKEAVEDNIRKFFGALSQAEQGHIDLIKNLI